MSNEANDRGYNNLLRYSKIDGRGNWPSTGHYYTIGMLGGHIVESLIKPETIDRDHRIYPEGHGNTDTIGQVLRPGNIPDEARWFFVESIRVDRDMHKEIGHDDITKSPLDFLMRFNAFNANRPLKGAYVRHWDTNEDFTTSVKGKEITRKRLSLHRHKVDDSWLRELGLDIGGPNQNSLFNGSLAGFDISSGLRQTTYDAHWGVRPEDEYSNRRAQLTMSMDRFITSGRIAPVLPLTIDWSFFKGRASTYRNNVLEFPIGTAGFKNVIAPGTGSDLLFNTLFPNSENLHGKMVPGLTTSSSGQHFGVIANVQDSPQLKRFKYSPPNFVLKQSSDEDSDYLMFNENYAEAQRQSDMISTVIEAAGLLNPFTFHATLARMLFIKGPQTALSYLEEQARKDDAMNNYNGTDLPNRIVQTGTNSQYSVLGTNETQTLTFNTQKQLITADGEVSEIPEDRYIELPINKLFKKTSEFEEWINSQPGYGILRTGYYKVTPYMNMGKYGKAYEHWARFK